MAETEGRAHTEQDVVDIAPKEPSLRVPGGVQANAARSDEAPAEAANIHYAPAAKSALLATCL